MMMTSLNPILRRLVREAVTYPFKLGAIAGVVAGIGGSIMVGSATYLTYKLVERSRSEE